ncbi:MULTISPECIES: hypothetical protein [Sulfolobaceae]|uniref:Uncharacterized protein n=2 Tax=Sulfurisphaera tokodaii TaxID=111955 RepID=F9VML3_SULTO|nr:MULTISPECIES: hypothetical protein [Sulfolobaceae]QIW22970.1 hypothetical protein EWF20_01540 [Sulfolobus sp. S-194]BAK54159.1 hypothetical protein STK_01255 [Sulfurisphaera tokodaii str. 7]HII74123.1 hypothetical protein [Sulfurisphaera tokodaii]
MESVLPEYIYDIQHILSIIKYNTKLDIKINHNDPVQLQELYEFLDDLLNMLEFMSAYKLINLEENEIREVKDKIRKDMELISESIDKLMYESD